VSPGERCSRIWAALFLFEIASAGFTDYHGAQDSRLGDDESRGPAEGAASFSRPTIRMNQIRHATRDPRSESTTAIG
jgi:hypothetical protein